MNWIARKPTVSQSVVGTTSQNWLHKPIPGLKDRSACVAPIVTPSFHGHPPVQHQSSHLQRCLEK